MTGWGRLGGFLAAVGLLATLSGCGQLFTDGSQPVTLGQLSSQVDSLNAQVAQLQAALVTGGAAQASTVPPGLASAMVEADVLNVRDDPSITGTIRGSLLQNAVVGILKEDGTWTEITYTNPKTQVTLTGWVDSDYLGPVTPAAGAPAPSGQSAGPMPGGSAAAANASSASMTSAY